MQYGSGILGSALVSNFADGTPRPMAIVIAACGVGSLLCAQFLPQPNAASGSDLLEADVPDAAAK
jgi:DHA1 family bicyclomycin/chloramphenicol resistance-like MFS transporter